MTTKEDVIALNRAHPDWTSRQLAEALGCLPAYVFKTAMRNGLVLPHTSPGWNDPRALRAKAKALRWQAERWQRASGRSTL